VKLQNIERPVMDRENQIRSVLQDAADKHWIAGAAALVWRDGAMQTACAGWGDIESQLPVERDTIFRIASMTKPIASVAALMLVEEGRIALTRRNLQTCTY
jgi:CubicO group peptidase (beta-lactamase class C family)